MRRKTKYTLLAMAGAGCYGTNPLFALPLYALGLGVNSVLFYRYLFAVIIFGMWVTFYKKISLKVSWHQVRVLIPMGFVYALSSLTLFMSYNYIDAGIASTILFVYPILVAVLMSLFYHEKTSKKTIVSIVLMSVGIALFYKGEPGKTLNLWGVALVLLSALSYALYMIGIKKIKALRKTHYSVISFYVMFFCIFVYLFNLKFGLDLQMPGTPPAWACIAALAVIPTIVSLETMTVSIKIIGPTLSAIIGALEPVTAVFFGVLVFHEHLSLRIMAGIVLILMAVFLIVLKQKPAKRSKKQLSAVLESNSELIAALKGNCESTAVK